MSIDRKSIRAVTKTKSRAHVGNGSSKLDVSMSEILSKPQQAVISVMFTQAKQSQFVESMMIIKTGSSRDEGEADIAVLKKMQKIYQKSGGLFKVNLLVCQVLVRRMEAGLSLGDAMGGIFSDQYANLVSAMNSGTKIVDAVKRATDRQKEMYRVEFKSNLKMGLAYIAVIVVCNLLHVLYDAYSQRKLEAPKAFRFFREPETQFAIANFVAQNSLLILLLTFGFIFINKSIVPHLSGEKREFVDAYYPPSWLYKRKLAISMFSNITLLIKDAGAKPKAAIKTLIDRALPYEKDHLTMIQTSMSRGDEGTDQFSTGLLPEGLNLQLQLAGQGEGASVNTALQIISTSGHQELVKSMNRTSTYIMFGFIVLGLWLAAGGLTTGIYMFKSMTQ